MRFALTLLILPALILSACAGVSTPTPTLAPLATSTATNVPPTSTVGTPTATLRPTPTHLPNAIPTDELEESVFHFDASNPVLQRGTNINWDNVYMDPGAMIYHTGQFHMFYNGINAFPAPVGVGYATSPDGYVWTRQATDRVLSGSAVNDSQLLGSNLFVTSALVEDDGTWVLYFYTLDGTFTGPGEIGRASAPDPLGPWAIDSEPMLSPGPAGAWDDVQVSGPDVIRTTDGYIMYYDALGKKNQSMIGMATSSDGIHWTKYDDPATSDAAFADSDPVLTTGEESWEGKRVLDPNVIETSNGWVMIYLATTGSGKFNNGSFSFGLATSEDGVHWNRSTQNPVLSTRDHPQWAATYLATLLHANDTYFLYFDFVTPTEAGTNIYLATYAGELE